MVGPAIPARSCARLLANSQQIAWLPTSSSDSKVQRTSDPLIRPAKCSKFDLDSFSNAGSPPRALIAISTEVRRRYCVTVGDTQEMIYRAYYCCQLRCCKWRLECALQPSIETVCTLNSIFTLSPKGDTPIRIEEPTIT